MNSDSVPGLPYRVVLLLCDSMLAASHTAPVEMLRTAEAFTRIQMRGAGVRPMTFHYVSNSFDAVMTRSQFTITPTDLPVDIDSPDLVLIPSLWRGPRRVVAQYSDYLPHLTRWFDQGAHLIAGGTGSCFLAQAGLLDGLPATTHWHHFDQFERDYPKVQLKREYFITQSGRLFCAASLNAMADLIVYFIQRFYGLACAHHVERHFSHEVRQPYEQRRFLQGDANRHTDEDILNLQLWLQHNLAEEVLLGRAAEIARMSPRNLSRRFKLATGQSFNEYLGALRIDAAKELLKNSNLSVGQVAERVGYGDSAYFSRLFKRLSGVSPRAFRQSLRLKIFSLSVDQAE